MSPQRHASFASWFGITDTAAAWLQLPFAGERNAVCWRRQLVGDFDEVARLAGALDADADRLPLDDEALTRLHDSATPAGRLAITTLREDLRLLREQGHEPGLELLRRYPRDGDPDLPTDVHSFHVDSATVPTETILCTYAGPATELLPRDQARRRVDQPELRARLRRRFGDGDDAVFAAWLAEHAFDLHFVPKPGAVPWRCGPGELWRLAVLHPGVAVPACVHRAPPAPAGSAPRLLLIS